MRLGAAGPRSARTRSKTVSNWSTCAAQESPDLVITDIRMPVMNGDEALRLIYAQRRFLIL